MSRGSGRLGFTLIEVMVALAITGLIALMARRLVQVTIDSVQVLAQTRERADHAANARSWLRATMLSMDIGDSAGGFTGNSNRMEFSSWMQQPEGWLVRRRIALEDNHSRFVARVTAQDPIVIQDSVISVDFDYLLEPGADTKWVRQWISPISAPLAVRIRVGRMSAGVEITDTLLLLIKERG